MPPQQKAKSRLEALRALHIEGVMGEASQLASPATTALRIILGGSTRPLPSELPAEAQG